MTVGNSQVEALVTNALRDWLLWQLPAKVASINGIRFATLRATTPGPYTIPASATLGLSHTFNNATFTAFSVPSGSRTTAQMVTTINTAMGGTPASADADDRLLYTSPTAPVAATPSKVWLRGGTATDCNSIFGWDPGGEKELVTALVTPQRKGVRKGLPQVPDFGPAGTVAVIIGNCSSKPSPGGPRRDQHYVTVDMDIIRVDTQQQDSAEPIEAAVRCVREVLLTDAGRQLGRARNGDIALTEIPEALVSPTGREFKSKQTMPTPYFRGAVMRLGVRVFERPAAT